MSRLAPIVRREFSAYFNTPLAAVFLVMFLFLTGIFTFNVGQLYERGQADLREQPLRAAAREVEDRLGVDARLRVADDRHVARVLDVEECARGSTRGMHARRVAVVAFGYLIPTPQRLGSQRSRGVVIEIDALHGKGHGVCDSVRK
jgi:hypothetical protein